jgi:Tfp pilus assembly protein PilN
VRAVNLIPADSRQRFGAPGQSGGLAYVLVGLLAAGVVLVTVYVLTINSISSRRARIASIERQAADESALAARLAPYSEFARLAEERAQTVREIAAARFDWHAVLAQLARVVPANTSLQSLVGTVAPGAGGVNGASGSTDLRPDIATPAIELSGCSRTQDDVAALLSRLKLMSGVTRVALEDSQESSSGQSGTSTSGAASGCPANSPSFNVVVWFAPLPGAGPDGLVPVSSTSNAPSAGAGAPATATPSSPTTTTSATPTTTTTSATPTTTTSTPAGSAPGAKTTSTPAPSTASNGASG